MKCIFSIMLIILLSTCTVQLNEANNLVVEGINPPTGLTILPYSTSSVIISWQEVVGAYSYSIYFSRNEFGIYELMQTINENTYVIPNLLIDTKYFFKVSASKNNFGESKLSIQVAITIVDLPKPTGLIASTVSPTNINITWTNIIEATGYRIYRATTSFGPYIFIGSTTETNYTDTELETGITYFYRISGVKNEGEGVSSDYASAFTPVSTPTGIMGIVQSMNSVKLSWNPVYRASEYNVYRSLTQDGYYNLIGTTSELFYIDNGLVQLTDYFYKVAAKNSNGEGNQSEYIVITIAPLPPPLNIISSVLSSSSIKLDWENVIGATGYNIYRSTGGGYNLIGSVSINSFTNTGLNLNVNYYYKISSVNIVGEGEQSDAVSIKIEPPSTPQNFTAESYTETSIKLSWDYVSGALMYEIYEIKYDLAGGYRSRIGTTTDNIYLVSNLQAGMPTYYEYCVRAINSIGSSNYSSTRQSYVKPILLTENIEYASNVSGWTDYTSSTSRYFSFPADGSDYIISWTNSNRLGVSCYWKNANTIPASSNTNTYFFINAGSPQNISTPAMGYILITVEGSYQGGGNFSIKYTKK